MLRTLILVTRGIILDPRVRRWAMFVTLLGALVMLFAGSTFLAGDLTSNKLTFVIYWFVCAWLTLAALLLAIWDMLLLRLAARRERRVLEQLVKDQHSVRQAANPDDHP